MCPLCVLSGQKNREKTVARVVVVVLVAVVVASTLHIRELRVRTQQSLTSIPSNETHSLELTLTLTQTKVQGTHMHTRICEDFNTQGNIGVHRVCLCVCACFYTQSIGQDTKKEENYKHKNKSNPKRESLLAHSTKRQSAGALHGERYSHGYGYVRN